MEQLCTGSFTALVFNARLVLAQLSQHVGERARELYLLAAAEGLMPTGPVYWIYTGADGDPHTLFDLKIALPVTGLPHTAALSQLETIPPMTALAILHKGPWAILSQAYAQLARETGSKGLLPSGENRELYLQIDFERPENNLTLVMFGIQ
ncbi:MAG: hypothetical protein QM786_19185 [Breznakibacter sp.]